MKNEGLKAKITRLEQEHEVLIITNKILAIQLEEKDDMLGKFIGGSQKLSNMLLVQKNPLHILSLEGDNCGGNFNKCNNFAKVSSSNICMGESGKQESKLENTKAFGRQYAKRKSTKPKGT